MNAVWLPEGPSGSVRSVRASVGTLARLGLMRMRLSAEPKTAYLLTPGGCLGRCSFCPQWLDEDRLSRLRWPAVDVSRVVEGQDAFERICIQSTLRRGFAGDVEYLASLFETPVSISINPVHEVFLSRLSRRAERIGVGLDAMSVRVFSQVRKPGSWGSYMHFIRKSIGVFGRGRVHVHLIAGMGETIEEAIRTMKLVHDIGAEVALFSFTPVPGTPMGSEPSPDLLYYRKLQVIRYFISKRIPLEEVSRYDPDDYREAFLTSGCPSCNRPFYNERPRGPIYNFPSEELLKEKWEETRREVISAVEDLGIRSQW